MPRQQPQQSSLLGHKRVRRDSAEDRVRRPSTGNLVPANRVKRPSTGIPGTCRSLCTRTCLFTKDLSTNGYREILQKTELEVRVQVTWYLQTELKYQVQVYLVPAYLSVLELVCALVFTPQKTARLLGHRAPGTSAAHVAEEVVEAVVIEAEA
jgi:hypothetical protein